MLRDVSKGDGATHGIKVANGFTLKWGYHPGLSGWGNGMGKLLKWEERGMKRESEMGLRANLPRDTMFVAGSGGGGRGHKPRNASDL